MSNQLKAEQLRYMFIFNPPIANKELCGKSIKSGYMIGLFVLFFLEILYYTLGCSDFSIYELLFIGLFVWSLVKVILYLVTACGLKKLRFDKCYFGYTTITIFIWIDLITSVLGIILYLFGYNIVLECLVPRLIFHINPTIRIYIILIYLALIIILQLIILYIGYSFTKKLGMENTNSTQTQEYTPPSTTNISALRASGNIFSKTTKSNPDDVIIFNNSIRGSNNTFKSNNSKDLSDENNMNKSFYLDNFNFHLTIHEKIELKTHKDIEFASRAQKSIVNDTTFPSGLKVPIAMDGRNWIIYGNEVILV
jgi:hypothetical protein